MNTNASAREEAHEEHRQRVRLANVEYQHQDGNMAYSSPPVASAFPPTGRRDGHHGETSHQRQEHIYPTYPGPQEGHMPYYHAAASGDQEVRYPQYGVSDHHSWQQQIPRITYGAPIPPSSYNAYGSVADGSAHYTPGGVQIAPSSERLHSYGNIAVGNFSNHPPSTMSHSSLTDSYFAAARGSGIYHNTGGELKDVASCSDYGRSRIFFSIAVLAAIFTTLKNRNSSV